MADMGVTRVDIKETPNIKILKLQVLIQERKSRIVRLKQDIEDLTELAIRSKQAEVETLQLELNKLNDDLDRVGNFGNIIDVEAQ